MLWRDAGKRGANVPIHSRARAILKCYDPSFEEDGDAVFERREDDGEDEGGRACAGEGVPRPIGFSFDFIEVCGGCGVVTTRLVGMGVVCGPILDITYGPPYNLMENRVIPSLIFMMEERKVRSFLVVPPCTTSSAAAHRSFRSYAKPEG